MKTDDEIKQWAEEHGLTFIFPSGYPEAFVGATDAGEEDRAVYDQDKIIAILMARDGMTRGDAEEHFSFNIEGGTHPETGVIFIHTATG